MGMRRNGFQRPHHLLQLVSWFVFSFLGLSYHFFILPAFSTWVHRLILSLVYWCFAGPMVYFGWRMTGSDPLDEVVIEARQQRKLHWAGTPPAPDVYDYPLEDEPHSVREARRCDPHILALSATGDEKTQRNWCPYCFEHVHPSSKHCKLCDKCVSDFDHHCKWLNSCVGGKNYHLFFLAMSFALLLLAYQCALSLYLFIETFMDDYDGASPALYIDYHYSGASGFAQAAFQVLMGVTVCISAPLFLSLLQLFMLHVYLWKRQITTYEWIMERRNEIKAKEEAMAARAGLKGKEEEEAGNTTAGGGGTMMHVAPKRASHPGETPRGDEEGRVLSNLRPGETDPYPGYLNSLRESANQRRMEEEAAQQHQQWQSQDGTMRLAQRLEHQQQYHSQHQQGNGVGFSTYSQHQQDPYARDGHEMHATGQTWSRDGSFFQPSPILSPQRTVTVTSAEVGLSTTERAPNGGGLSMGRLGRPISASDREASQRSGTDSPHAGAQPYVQHGRYGSGSNMNLRVSRPTSAKDVAGQPQPHHVTMHVTVTAPGARSSFSSDANAQPDASPTSSVRGSNKAYALPPIVGRSGSLEMQSPLKGKEAISPSSYDSPQPHSGANNSNNLMPMPGMIGSNEVSPSSMKKKDMLTSPTSVTVLPNTPTANMSFAAGLSSSSAVVNSSAANHQPAMYGDVNTANSNGRSMEEEAEAFLNDPSATEPRFQQTESQRARAARR